MDLLKVNCARLAIIINCNNNSKVNKNIGAVSGVELPTSPYTSKDIRAD